MSLENRQEFQERNPFIAAILHMHDILNTTMKSFNRLGITVYACIWYICLVHFADCPCILNDMNLTFLTYCSFVNNNLALI